MIYPHDLEKKLGFDQIRQFLAEACLSTLGQAFVGKMHFQTDFATIDKLARQTAEMKEIYQFEPGFPSSNYLDITTSLRHLRIEGAALGVEEFHNIHLTLTTVAQCRRFLGTNHEKYTQLFTLSRPIAFQEAVVKSIEAIIDHNGLMRDNASPQLVEIRKTLASEIRLARKKLEDILRAAKASHWVGDDTAFTIRGGRLVIPVPAENKRKIKGFVHDESATGQTVYIEPADVLESNNGIRELEHEEAREIQRILLSLADNLRPHLDDLGKATRFLGLMDFLRAKAKLAVEIEAINPLFENSQIINWQNAYHPLLLMAHRKKGKTVVPLSISLQHDRRILVISGPNAGGKSVAIKAVGLIQYMYQCGLLVPMKENSTLGIFYKILLDIGDEQSIENDLSTYSSHLTHMRFFLKNADRYTLFIIDEFGTGTEPGMGGAIAQAILEELVKSGAYGVLNTHFSNLKVLADKTPGLVNGAMRFDDEHLEPLFEFEAGQPGSSFAFEIASKIGLPENIIEKAKLNLGHQQVSFENLLKDLNLEKRVFSEKNMELGIKERKLAQQIAEYAALKLTLDNRQKQLQNDAKQKAKALLVEANRLIENTIREIRENKAEKATTRTLRAELSKFDTEALKTETLEAGPSDALMVEKGPIQPGSFVRLKGQLAVGQVLSVKGKEAEIHIGELKSTVRLNRLEKVSAKVYRETIGEKQSRQSHRSVDLNKRMMDFSFNLDLRGKRGEEAMVTLDQFINNGLMLGYDELRVIHGKGDGILRSLVRNHLHTFKEVAAIADEHADRGGAGVTIVRLA